MVKNQLHLSIILPLTSPHRALYNMSMDSETIRALNKLNQRFYNQVAEHFHTTRQFYWHGWRTLLPYLEEIAATEQELRVLDIGCGNGRFGKFLNDTLPDSKIEYHGTDFNQSLLEFAQTSLKKTRLSVTLTNLDMTSSLQSKKPLVPGDKTYHIIVLFGVLHHIPSYQLRKQLLQTLAERLEPNGLLCCTLWRFIDPAAAEMNTIDPANVHIDSEQLEPHDYFIPWERGVSAIRYCHYTPQYEEDRLIAASNLHLIRSFEADGKEGKGNKYLLLKKQVA